MNIFIAHIEWNLFTPHQVSVIIYRYSTSALLNSH